MSKKKSNFFIIYILVLLVIVFGIYKSGILNKLNYPLMYKEQVSQSSLEHNVDKYLIYAVIKRESGFYPYAKSHKDAKGLMQISDMTWKWARDELKTIDENPFLVSDNIDAGSWYLSKLIRHYDNIQIALLAYNAGSGNVDEWIKEGRLSGTDYRNWDVPFNESRRYIDNVTEYYFEYKRIYGDNNEE